MPDATRYLADFQLTTLVRPESYADGTKGWEPLWFQAGDTSGLAVFVSALDAEIYRQQAMADGRVGWSRVALDRFDLLAHIRSLDGMLYCQMVIGFVASMSGGLALREGLPRPRLVPLPFELSVDTPAPVTFHFNVWVFNFMREQWALVGAKNYAEQVESMNAASNAELAATATHALRSVTHTNTTDDDHDWCIYEPQTGAWIFGPDESRQAANLH
jgi:hypothetical protein